MLYWMNFRKESVMEKRIFGRRYNTDTAKLVTFNASKSLGLDYYFESVYRKRNGEYFSMRAVMQLLFMLIVNMVCIHVVMF